MWFSRDTDGDDPARDGSAADDTVCTLLPNDEGDPVVMFLFLSGEPNLVSFFGYRFSNPCPSDFREPNYVPVVAL